MRKLTIKVREQLNANRNYYYPADTKGKLLLELMDRKTFVKNDIPKLKAFFESIDIELAIVIKPKKERTL